MSKLKELLVQKEALEKQIIEIRALEVADAIAKVNSLIAEYNLTQDDIFGKTRKSSTDVAKVAKTIKVPAKYRDTATGNEWSGRGMTPKWLQGKDKSQYLIA